jgi:uncharacterized membrane protein
MKAKSVFLVLGAIAAPFLLISLYLYFSRWPTRWFTSASDFIALGLSLAIGIVFLLRLPVSFGARVAAAICYVPILGAVLIFYSLMLVGFVFNDWL